MEPRELLKGEADFAAIASDACRAMESFLGGKKDG
jgi:hypothetical protein